ncbi:MAG TPA: PilZ domain-containing protein [Stellaceae bacterium]|nr:PilZ domain-containing protein [Stellaceae bacterium]
MSSVDGAEPVAGKRASTVRQLRRPANKLNRRWPTNWLAKLVISADEFLCIIEDLSDGGAKLRVGALPPAEDAVALVITNYEPIGGVIAWRSGDRIGLTFNERQPFVEDLLLKAAHQAVSSFTPTAKTRAGKLSEL